MVWVLFQQDLETRTRAQSLAAGGKRCTVHWHGDWRLHHAPAALFQPHLPHGPMGRWYSSHSYTVTSQLLTVVCTCCSGELSNYHALQTLVLIILPSPSPPVLPPFPLHSFSLHTFPHLIICPPLEESGASKLLGSSGNHGKVDWTPKH